MEPDFVHNDFNQSNIGRLYIYHISDVITTKCGSSTSCRIFHSITK